ncbi:hypothetical protein SADUNF_Sadunf16G0157500 [Salix dunnii]|uniref:RIN4 pathogenic type III effector avirulence factor Avr cleavage site domain-containing protein n=1 Tax=Salix dunnii TaxID=1413687 RepID=A0A835J715_9ROSI|nr:hypothetical protein SADUNF_Sadunf16G0157500 [Salix dunnii]
MEVEFLLKFTYDYRGLFIPQFGGWNSKNPVPTNYSKVFTQAHANRRQHKFDARHISLGNERELLVAQQQEDFVMLYFHHNVLDLPFSLLVKIFPNPKVLNHQGPIQKPLAHQQLSVLQFKVSDQAFKVDNVIEGIPVGALKAHVPQDQYGESKISNARFQKLRLTDTIKDSKSTSCFSSPLYGLSYQTI